jgi:hypothetical protein
MCNPTKVHYLLLKLPFWPMVEPVLLDMQIEQLPHDLELVAQDVLMLIMMLSQQMQSLLPFRIHHEVAQITISLLEHLALIFKDWCQVRVPF